MPRLCRLINVRRPRAPVTIQGGGATTIRQVTVAYRRDGSVGGRVTQKRVPESTRLSPGKTIHGLPETFGQVADVQRQVRLGWIRVEYYDESSHETPVSGPARVPTQKRGHRQGSKNR